LNDTQRDSLEACKQELNEFIGAMAVDFPHMTFTDQGGGLIHLSARRTALRPMQVIKFSRGSARALALEFYPESADALASGRAFGVPRRTFTTIFAFLWQVPH
jgi:hypothetical protein